MKLYAPELAQDTSFPAANETNLGRLLFLNKRVWIAAEIAAGVVTWIPLTNEIDAYQHVQDTASTTWTITHNLSSGAPVVQIYDDTHTMVIPDSVDPQDQNTVVVTFSTAMSGSAIIIAGNTGPGVDRSENPLQFSYEQEFTASATWVIPHGLGYYPIVRTFIGNQEVQPASVIHDSIMQTTVTWSSPQTGIARLI